MSFVNDEESAKRLLATIDDLLDDPEAIKQITNIDPILREAVACGLEQLAEFVRGAHEDGAV